MRRGRRFTALVTLLTLAAIAARSFWRPWEQGPPADPITTPVPDGTSLTIPKRSSPLYSVQVMGGSPDGSAGVLSVGLAVGEAKSVPFRPPDPYTVQAVTVTQNGRVRRHELNRLLTAGQPYELVIQADDPVELNSRQ